MRLLIDPEPPYLCWCRYGDAPVRSSRGLPGPEWRTAAAGGPRTMKAVTSVSYRLQHGGDLIHQPATRITTYSLASLRGVLRFMPESNELTYGAMNDLLPMFPDVPHFMLCDTAFFADLPVAASAYAVPAELRQRGVRRYGGAGLTHEWAWERTRELCGPQVHRLVSIQLSDGPNLAAIRDGHPLETTIGFTAVEGIPSRTGCGDIDASIVFELQAAGMSLAEINEVLSVRSGFQALVGRHWSLRQLLTADEDGAVALARKILRYDIVRYLGAFAATLDGLDAVAFVAEDPVACAGLIQGICEDVGFLGLRVTAVGASAADSVISTDDSGIKAVVLKGNRWRAMAARTAAAEQGES